MVQLIQTFGGDKVPKEDVHHTCVTCRSIDSVMQMEKKIIHKQFRRMKI